MPDPHPQHVFDLSDRVALVTGASRGLGREMALAFAAAGAAVGVTGRDRAACVEVVAQIERHGGRAVALPCHVGRWDRLPDLVDACVAAFGRLDILVNNAGKSIPEPSLLDTSERLFDSVVDLNLKGPFRLAVLAAGAMRASPGPVNGSIINVSSIHAMRPAVLSLPYSAAKAGLENLTVGLAQALGPHIRVNAIRPGSMATAEIDPLSVDDRLRLDAMTALRRAGRPREIVGAALYLASDASSFSTGAVIAVDGGWA